MNNSQKKEPPPIPFLFWDCNGSLDFWVGGDGIIVWALREPSLIGFKSSCAHNLLRLMIPWNAVQIQYHTIQYYTTILHTQPYICFFLYCKCYINIWAALNWWHGIVRRQWYVWLCVEIRHRPSPAIPLSLMMTLVWGCLLLITPTLGSGGIRW